MDKAFFVQRYLIEKKSYAEIAKELGWNRSSVSYYLKKYGIPIQDVKEKQKSKALRGVEHPMFGKPGVLKGKHHSEETKKKIGLAHLGVKEKPITQETRKKLSEGQKKRPRKPDDQRITPLYRGIRLLSQYKEWRLNVYHRDAFTCQHCFVIGGQLNADHIVALADLMRTNRITSITEAINCVSLWNISNGQTLCVECHRKTKTYGGGSKVKK